MPGNGVHAKGRQVIDRRAQPDGGGNRRRAGLELVGNRVVDGFLERHRQDHVAAALEGLHFLKQRGLAVKHANAGWPAQLVAREGIEVAVQVLHIYGQVRRGLRAIDQHRHTALVRQRDHLFDRVDAAQRVRDMAHADQLGTGV